MQLPKTIRLLLACTAFAGMFTLLCRAHADLSGLNGTVRYGAGRSLPGAHILAVEESTGLEREAVSASSGTYAIPDLPIGLYQVTCTAPGFR